MMDSCRQVAGSAEIRLFAFEACRSNERDICRICGHFRTQRTFLKKEVVPRGGPGRFTPFPLISLRNFGPHEKLLHRSDTALQACCEDS